MAPKKKTTEPTIAATTPANPAALEVTSVQVFPIREPLGKTRAFARLVLADQMQITGMRVAEGANGLFVAYPNDPGYKGEDFRSIYYPVTRELREAIEKAVLDKYHEVTSAEG